MLIMVANTWIKQCYSVFFIFCSFIFHAQSDVPRPRGVPLSKASLYSPTNDFTCFDGSAAIPFSHVNDDYCDCFDGSDEPGTPACLNGIFHCTNTGHRALNIPTSRINDGFCDCCDGTDEYASPDTCSNTCEELGQEARAEALRIAVLYKAGHHLRQEFIEKGNKKRSEMAEQLAQLEKDKVEAESLKNEKESIKNELEIKENEALKVYREAEELERQKKAAIEREKTIKEAMEHFTRFDANSDGILTQEEVGVVNVFDKNKNGEVDDEEIKYFFMEKETIDKETFVDSTWQLLKPLLMMEQGMFRPAENVEKEDEDADEQHGDGEDDQEDLDTDYAGNDDDNADIDSPNDDGEEPEQEMEHQESTPTYDEETQKLVQAASEARKQLTEAERTVREIESNIQNIQQNLEKDYGLQQEFTTLDGECLEYEDKEYIYRLCLFQKVTQKSKNGGGEIGLGNWGEWAGPDSNKYSVMKYVNGMNCWNGPNRITTVNINCGLETKVLSVTEPFRCEYKIEISIPAACDNENISLEHTSHDEL